ncbi:MAG: hypothetical protein A2Z04_07055 [Chloroflexi bacterium RBG_16_57_9]|nr:MAG: hypothetical protein A2Z04_07055 [Chloroflexi bacterium RBG_16_57_9]
MSGRNERIALASGDYLIDTDVLIDHLRGNILARDFLGALLLDGATLHFSVISEAEIYSNVRPGEGPRIRALFEAMSRLPIDGAIARRAGTYQDLLRATIRLALSDALIAATAQEHEATLVTRNVRHYPMTDVVVVEPYTIS